MGVGGYQGETTVDFIVTNMSFTPNHNTPPDRQRSIAGGANGKSEMLAELRILVAEDEALVAIDLDYALREAGAEVIGPVSSVDAGVTLLASVDDIDGAILDVDLRGELVFPLADMLRDAGVPIVFHTARGDREEFRKNYPDALLCIKPTQPHILIARAAEIFG